ncbi:MAG: PAS domain S-box protein, partial [Candidatus Binatia bacterium]
MPAQLASNAITYATRAEEEQQTLIAVIESSSDFIGIATPTGQVLYVNQAGQELVGWEGSSAALRSMTFYDFHPEEDATFMREQFVEGLPHDEHWEGELRLRHFQTGLPIPIYASACLVKHSLTREPIAIAMIGRDSTERKRMEEALRESERRLSRILESAMDAIVSIDERRHVSLFNAAAEKVFRCPATEVIGRPFDRFLSDRFRHALEGYVRIFARGGEAEHPMWAPEGLTARRADGEEFPIEATISRVEVAGQKLYTIILRDIDERKQAEEELRKLQLANVYLQEEIRTEYNFEEIVGTSKTIKKVFQHVERVASTDSTVLLTGETGTGKEL